MKELICTAILLLAVSAAWAAKAHQHGAATLSVAVDGNTLELEFESPLENLVGFEHAPRNDQERQALQALKGRFADPQALFVPDAAAQCRAMPAQVELPQAHSEQGGHEHGDMLATISFACAAPAALRSLEVRLFDAFPRLQRVNARLAVPGRQTAAELNRRKHRIDW